MGIFLVISLFLLSINAEPNPFDQYYLPPISKKPLTCLRYGCAQEISRAIYPISGKRTLTSELCENYKDNVVKIDANNLHIEQINADAFKSCKNLEVLWLDSNKLVNIEPNTLAENRKLREFAINDNKLQYIPSNLFKGLDQLKKLWVNANPDLDTIDPLIKSELNNLEFLGIANIGLTDLNVEVIRRAFPKLKELSIRNNRIPCPKYEKLVSDLKRLGYRVFDYIDGVYKVKEDEKCLPSWSNSQPCLQNGCKTEINQSIIRSWYGQKTLPPDFCNKHHSNVFSIDASELGIDEVDVNAFKYCTNLKTLRLNGNNIRTLHQDTFNYNKQLRELTLAANQLTNLPDNIFQNLGNLQKLILNGNPNLYRNRRLFCTRLENLEELGLANVGLNDLDIIWFVDNFPKLIKVNILNNSFACNQFDKFVYHLNSIGIEVDNVIQKDEVQNSIKCYYK